MNTLYLALVVIGGLLLVLGLTSGVIKTRLPLSEPLVALVVGVLVWPLVARLLRRGRGGDDAARRARAAGVPASRAETAEDFARQLRAALAEPGPSLIEAIL